MRRRIDLLVVLAFVADVCGLALAQYLTLSSGVQTRANAAAFAGWVEKYEKELASIK